MHDETARERTPRFASLLERQVEVATVVRAHELELHARIWKCGLDDVENGPDLLKEHVRICFHPAQLN